MRRRWMLGPVIGCVLTGVVFARMGVLVTTDGKKIEGDVSERNDQYVVNIHGVETTFAKSDVTSVNYSDDYAKDFADKLAKLPPTDVNGRIALARDAFGRRQYQLARQALDSALSIDPNNREATDLQNTIYSQMRLEQNRTGPADARNTPTPPPVANGVERRLLTSSEINLMRQKELQASDNLNVRFDNNVEKRFMQYANMSFSQFNTLKPVDKALMILDKGDDTMKADVKILGDPGSIVDYRRNIQPVVMNGCATSNCHGGLKGGNFILYTPADTDAIVYTNLFILMRYKTKVAETHSGSVFAPPERKMIDRGSGVRSLLAQYGLPANVSDVDHPQVMGYDFVFHNMDDVRFKQLLDWENRSLKQPDPDYSMIKYNPPVATGAATTQPATRPAR